MARYLLVSAALIASEERKIRKKKRKIDS